MESTRTGAPLVSVVTPFYNSGDTLDRCIRSVRSQGFTDFEYILADNRSTDGSSDIARRHALEDPRIRYVLCEDHLPKDANYNRALRMISAGARFCKIVQADDWIYESCLNEMVRVGLAHPSIGVVGARRTVGEAVDPSPNTQLPEVASGLEIGRRALLNEIYPFGSPTSVMYRADLVREKSDFYDARQYFNDVDVILQILRTTDFGFCDAVLTHTHRDPGSTFGRVQSYYPNLVNHYAMLQRYGADYFPPQEFRRHRDKIASHYYVVTLRSMGRADRRSMLQFHRRVLRGAGARWELLPAITGAASLGWNWVRKRVLRRSARSAEI